MVIDIKGRHLQFDNYTWHSWVKNVDWDNLEGSSNRAAVFAALSSYAYDNKIQSPNWKEAGDFYRTFTIEDIKKMASAFEEMNEYKLFIEKANEEIAKMQPKEAKKKPLKASRKT